MLYAPPTTGIFHQLHKGWGIGDHLAALQLDVLNHLYWAKTENGQKNINRPTPTERPGVPQITEADEASEFTVTVEDYLRYVAEAREREEED